MIKFLKKIWMYIQTVVVAMVAVDVLSAIESELAIEKLYFKKNKTISDHLILATHPITVNRIKQKIK